MESTVNVRSFLEDQLRMHGSDWSNLIMVVKSSPYLKDVQDAGMDIIWQMSYEFSEGLWNDAEKLKMHIGLIRLITDTCSGKEVRLDMMSLMQLAYSRSCLIGDFEACFQVFACASACYLRSIQGEAAACDGKKLNRYLILSLRLLKALILRGCELKTSDNMLELLPISMDAVMREAYSQNSAIIQENYAAWMTWMMSVMEIVLPFYYSKFSASLDELCLTFDNLLKAIMKGFHNDMVEAADAAEDMKLSIDDEQDFMYIGPATVGLFLSIYSMRHGIPSRVYNYDFLFAKLLPHVVEVISLDAEPYRQTAGETIFNWFCDRLSNDHFTCDDLKHEYVNKFVVRRLTRLLTEHSDVGINDLFLQVADFFRLFESGVEEKLLELMFSEEAETIACSGPSYSVLMQLSYARRQLIALVRRHFYSEELKLWSANGEPSVRNLFVIFTTKSEHFLDYLGEGFVINQVEEALLFLQYMIKSFENGAQWLDIEIVDIRRVMVEFVHPVSRVIKSILKLFDDANVIEYDEARKLCPYRIASYLCDVLIEIAEVLCIQENENKIH